MISFAIRTEKFQGPIDLLLDLIEKRKLHISDISLAQVADDYMGHVEKMNDLPVGETANFILVASTLLLIKSLSLLPSLETTEEESRDIEELRNRLKILQDIRNKSLYIKEEFGKNFLFQREFSQFEHVVFSPTNEITPEAILTGIKNVISSIPKLEKLTRAIVEKVISLEEMMERLTERIKKSLTISFREFSNHGKNNKKEVIVSFLAMLELFKQGMINITQSKQFQDIQIENEQYQKTPDYSSR